MTDLKQVIGLGFCVGVEHAKYMARRFNDAGIPSIALHGGSSEEERISAKKKLVKKEINFIFTVDLYNEGVDIPEVNTVLFLRPTESMTIYVQQLGRGLRLCEGITDHDHVWLNEFIDNPDTDSWDEDNYDDEISALEVSRYNYFETYSYKYDKTTLHEYQQVYDKVNHYYFADEWKCLSDCIDKHFAVLSNKWKQTHYEDEYGNIIVKDWEKHIEYFIKNIFIPELEERDIEHNYEKEYNFIEWNFSHNAPIGYIPDFCDKIQQQRLDKLLQDEYIRLFDIEYNKIALKHQSKNAKISSSIHTGIEYENYIEQILQDKGFSVSRTPLTGDQGVDLIAIKNYVRIAIHCKYYSKPVGNKAVQEVIAGKDFYNCDYTCVVSNNSFTPAARKIAGISNVLLVNDNQIADKLNELIE